MNLASVESICIFGSYARCSRDQYSDQDILVVCDDRYRLKQLREFWISSGWSVSAYSSNRFSKMAQSGSLFVQHLKLEGNIVEDKGGWLRHKLDHASPKKSYSFDAYESVNLALPLERFESSTQINQCLLVADIAYVAVRNFGICYLADRGDFTFDYLRIVDLLANEFSLSENDSKTLKNLRAAKAAYRSGAEYNKALGTAQEIRNILSSFFPHRHLDEIGQSVSVRQLGNGYSTLRDFEALVMSQYDWPSLHHQSSSINLSQVWKWVRDPRSYSWQVRNFNSQSCDGHILNKAAA